MWVLFYLSFPTNNYPGFLYCSCRQGQCKNTSHIGRQPSSGSLSLQSLSVSCSTICCLGNAIWSSGNSRPCLGSCRPTWYTRWSSHFAITFLHRDGCAINATTSTQHPNTFHSSISFSKSDKLLVSEATHQPGEGRPRHRSLLIIACWIVGQKLRTIYSLRASEFAFLVRLPIFERSNPALIDRQFKSLS